MADATEGPSPPARATTAEAAPRRAQRLGRHSARRWRSAHVGRLHVVRREDPPDVLDVCREVQLDGAVKRGGEQVAGLVNLAGPINFHDDGIFSTLTRSEWFDADKLVDTFGNIPASFLCTTFQMLHPTSHLLRILKLMDRLEDLDYVQSYAAIQTWIFDQIDFPGAAFRQTIKDLYQGNQLINNQLIMAGQPIRLDNITCPVLTASACS